ncbi:Cda5 [Trypoxylus dichotomus]
MMLVRGALVVLLTCLALASSQRKVSRTTQVTEEIKPEINFQCPEEFGYYPHPSDCTLYHVCFFGRPVLESCTGGLMYSPELQTCDWPRNVGCDGTGEISLTSVVSSSNPPSSSSISSEPRTRYTASSKSSSSSISSQPSVIVTPRGQPRSLHHTQEIVKQQRYYDQDEEIPEQIAVVERQRTYRGQPAKVSDVQRDRDGLSPYGDNSIPSYSSRGEKISVISFGTSQQSNPSYSNHDVTPWHGSSSVKRSYQSIRNPSVVLLQPPTPTPTLQYNSNFHTQFLSIPQQESGFKPYFPNYDNYNVNPVFQEDESKQYKPPQVKQKEDYYYINPSGGITPKPATITQGRVVFLDNSKPVNQNTQVVFKQKPLKQESKTSATIVNFSLIHDNKPSDNKATSKNLPYHHHEDYKYPGNDDYGDYNSKDGERYYNSRIPDLLPYQKNNYENINPFSSDDFNVDEFFKGFDHFYGPERDATTTEVVPTNIPKSNLERTTEKVRTTTLNDYYYYDDYDEVTEKAKIKYTTTKQPERREKFGTSTIQSVAYGKKTKPKDEQYYYDEYDYDSESVAPTLAPVTEVPKPIRITTEPTTSTTQKLTTTTSPSTISYKIISSTTPSPVYTIRQRIRTTTLRTTNRPVHIDNRQKVLTTTDSDVNLRPDDLTTSRVEEASITPQKTVTTATNKALYNGTRHYESTHYDPYYIYDDVELYRDIEDYPQHYNSNNGGRQHTQSTYRGTPASSVQVLPTSEEVPKRKPAFQEHTYLPQDVYQPTVSEYNDGYVDDQSAYIRQSNRQSTNLRGDRNDINYIEEPTTTKRTTTTSTTTTTTTTPRPIPSQKSTVPSSRSPSISKKTNQTRALLFPNTLQEDEGQISTNVTKPYPEISLKPRQRDNFTDLRDVVNYDGLDNDSDINNHSVLNVRNDLTHLTTTQKPSFHFITKASKSTPVIQTVTLTPDNGDVRAYRGRVRASTRNIMPTTYAPPKHFLKRILPKSPNRKSNNVTESTTIRQHRTIKTIRKFINPIAINNEFASVNNNNDAVDYFENKTYEDYLEDDYRNASFTLFSTTPKIYTPTFAIITTPITTTTTQKTTTTTQQTTPKSTTTTTTTITPITTSASNSDVDQIELTPSISNLHYNHEPNLYVAPNKKSFRTTIEIPRPEDLLGIDENRPKPKPDQFPPYKPKPIAKSDLLTTKTHADAPRNTSIPARISRVNTAIKSLIALGGSRRPSTENQTAIHYNDVRQRTNTRGRGNLHYSTGGNGDAITVNRGTPPPRTRSTLKPSTSIVSKAAEFVDIYKYPPRRPDTIYPQPVPDKAAAKCRRDVCLLPDCSCGGKEIPGNLPVEEVPQIILLTFDDAVNDLNKEFYREIFDGRLNPNGCPISATFYVSHEWTDYSQVQNLYADGHELASHTVSELFERGRVNPNGCPIAATFYVSHEWTDYSQVQNLYSDGHEIASHTVSHSFGEQFSQKKWTKEVAGQREILAAYGGVKLEDVRGMRAPFLSVGGNKMFKMLYDSNFTFDSSMPIYENKPPSWPYTLDYKLFHDCMIPPCPTRSYPGVWEVPMVMWQDLNGGRCSMGDACSHPADADGVVKLLKKNFQRHYTTNRAPFGLFYHAAYFTKDHHKEGFIKFLDYINSMKDVYLVTNWQAIQWVRDPTPLSRLSNFQPFHCNYSDRPKRCNNPKVCNLWHKSGVRYMRTCQPCPDIYPWTGNTGIRSSRIDNDIED